MNKNLLLFCMLLCLGCSTKTAVQEVQTPVVVSVATQWPTEKANDWYKEKGWLVGSNFGPSTAINQLEMWQAESFDTAAINRELGWAENLGFNSMRVFLHDLLWQQDSTGFITRMENFLSIADKHHIGVMFVLFDGVWDPYPQTGKQRDPKPHVHNSGWMQSPGATILKDTANYHALQGYVKGVMKHFSNDERVHAWDLFNEPDNPNIPAYSDVELKDKAALSLVLLEKTFRWAREVNPDQPITAGLWYGEWDDTTKMKAMDKFMITHSDVITFHNYDKPEELERKILQLKKYNRPVLCTEYMARGNGSTFEGSLPVLKKYNVAAYNWGFVAGKTQTIYAWDSWRKQYKAEPELWFHDIYRANGKPYRETEVNLIRSLTTKGELK